MKIYKYILVSYVVWIKIRFKKYEQKVLRLDESNT